MKAKVEANDLPIEGVGQGTPSSDGLSTNQDTPGTMPTPYSLEVPGSLQKANFPRNTTDVCCPAFSTPLYAEELVPAAEPKPCNGLMSSLEMDPFLVSPSEVLNTSNQHRSTLSPTALSFHPRQRISSTLSIEMEGSGKSGAVLNKTLKDVSGLTSHPLMAGKSTSLFPKLCAGTKALSDFFDNSYPMGEFSGDIYTRYLQVHAGVQNYVHYNLGQFLKGYTQSQHSEIIVSKHKNGVWFLGFADIRDAVNTLGALSNPPYGLVVKFISAKRFAEEACPGNGATTSNLKGQLLLTATPVGPQPGVDAQDLLNSLLQLVKGCGSLLAAEITSANFPVIRVHFEYYNLEHAKSAKCLTSVGITGIEVRVEDYPDSVPSITPSISGSEPLVVQNDEDDIGTLIGGLSVNSTPTRAMPCYGELSPFNSRLSSSEVTLAQMSSGIGSNPPYNHPLNASKYDQPFGTQVVGLPLQTPQALIPIHHPSSLPQNLPAKYQGFGGQAIVRSHNAVVPRIGNGNNAVDLQRIGEGRDVRTTVCFGFRLKVLLTSLTIMLRNIPNKMPQAELKQIVDETNHGEYDFMYLRIDFANNCNVGYAFINFVDPLAIVKFIQARAGRKWYRYNSEKVAEISYATIQGKDCLVQKFRNSSVMLEDPSFRPKIFHTGTGPLAGMEETFPGPDNDSKLRRSIENAGAVGLFAPRAGQCFRDAQRRRRSQYDRGTHYAQIEETYGAATSQSNFHRFRRNFGGHFGGVAFPKALPMSCPQQNRSSA